MKKTIEWVGDGFWTFGPLKGTKRVQYLFWWKGHCSESERSMVLRVRSKHYPDYYTLGKSNSNHLTTSQHQAPFLVPGTSGTHCGIDIKLGNSAIWYYLMANQKRNGVLARESLQWIHINPFFLQNSDSNLLTSYALCQVPSSPAPPARQVPLAVALAAAAAAAAARVPVPATGQHQFSRYLVSDGQSKVKHLPRKHIHGNCVVTMKATGLKRENWSLHLETDFPLTSSWRSHTSGSEVGLEGALDTGSCNVAGKQAGLEFWHVLTWSNLTKNVQANRNCNADQSVSGHLTGMCVSINDYKKTSEKPNLHPINPTVLAKKRSTSSPFAHLKPHLPPPAPAHAPRVAAPNAPVAAWNPTPRGRPAVAHWTKMN